MSDKAIKNAQIEKAMSKAAMMPGIMDMAKQKAKEMLGIDNEPKSFLVKKGKKTGDEDVSD